MATAAAKRYAKAVFELAQADGDFNGWAKRLAEIRGLFDDPKVSAVLKNPTIPTEHREALVATAPHLLDEEASNLARLLIESGRIGDAAAIEDEFESLRDNAEGRVHATVTTAIELSAEDRGRVATELANRLGKEVKVSVVVDPRVIGGMRLQYGDHVVDATVANRLDQLRRRLAAS